MNFNITILEDMIIGYIIIVKIVAYHDQKQLYNTFYLSFSILCIYVWLVMV